MANLVEFDAGGVPRKPYDAARLLRELEAQFRLSQDPRERAILADWIVPEYIAYGDPERAAEFLVRVPKSDDPEIAARMASLRAIVHAMEDRNAEADLQVAKDLLPLLSSACSAVIEHRIALAHFFARQAHAAQEHALRGLSVADAEGLRRLAARIASVLYATNYHLTGDLQAARYYAEVATVEAAAGGDPMMRRQYLAAQFDLAVSFADWDKARSLLEMLRRDRWYDTYSAGPALQVGTVLIAGHLGDFIAMKGAADAFLASASVSGDIALANAFAAMALAASGRDDEAGRVARRALSISREATRGELAFQTMRRRLAAVLAAYVCLLIGDTHRGSRALRTRSKWPGDVGALARSFVDGTTDADEPDLQGLRGVTEVAHKIKHARLNRVQRIPERVRTLTHTELTLLRATATGKTNGEIARERGVTRNAVERRLMNAYEKLGVKNRTEAIAKLAEM